MTKKFLHKCQGDVCWCSGPNCKCDDPAKCQKCLGPICCTNGECCVGNSCLPTPGGSITDGSIGAAVAAGAIALISLLLSTLGSALALLTPAEAASQAMATIGDAINRFFGLFTKGKGRKAAKVGLIYDADSGLLIPMAKVLLFRARDNKLIAVTISDSKGHFALETPAGEEYFLEVKKAGLAMLPTNFNLFSKTTLAYSNNYFGQVFRPKESSTFFSGAIPLRYSTAATGLIKNSLRVEKLAKVFRLLNIPILLVGFTFSVMALILTHSWLNWLVFLLYIAIFLYFLARYLLRGHTFGLVYATANNLPVDLAVVRVISETSSKLVKTTVSNQKGRYNLALPAGYYKMISIKPNLEQATNQTIRVKNGFTPRKEKIGMRETVRNDETRMTNDEQNPNVQKSNQTKRTFEDAGEIIEKNQDKSGIGHLITPAIVTVQKPALPISKKVVEKNINHPNWRFQNPNSPL